MRVHFYLSLITEDLWTGMFQAQSVKWCHTFHVKITSLLTYLFQDIIVLCSSRQNDMVFVYVLLMFEFISETHTWVAVKEALPFNMLFTNGTQMMKLIT